jgi:hypothetical protein
VTAPADRLFLDALSDLAAALAAIRSPSMIIGGVAVIARGVPRQTIDIDATVWAEHVSIEELFAVLAVHGIDPRIPDAAAFAEQRQVLLLRHRTSGTPLEVSLAWLDFEREALERASVVDFGGVRVRVAAPEDLVVFKTVAWRDRDRADVERLLVRHAGAIDLARVRSLIGQFSDILETPERVQEFNALVARALGPESTG